MLTVEGAILLFVTEAFAATGDCKPFFGIHKPYEHTDTHMVLDKTENWVVLTESVNRVTNENLRYSRASKSDLRSSF